MKKKKKKNSVSEKLKDLLKSYKTIIYISFAINVFLLIFCYYLMSNNNVYTFSGEDEYLKVKDGLIALNADINVINGNNIKYINNIDYDIKEYKIGYYVMDDDKLVEIVSDSLTFDTEMKLSEIVNNFTSFNLVEKNNSAKYFTHYKKELLNDGLYLVLEAKTKDEEPVFSKVKLNITKISKF